jgi:undecaprenyl-diphosphatase
MLPIDSAIFLWFNASNTSPDWLITFALFATHQLPSLMLAGAAGAFIVGNNHVRQAVYRVIFAMIMAWLLARLGQHLWHFPRPFALGLGTQWVSHGTSSGFPSNHASVAFAFGASVAWSSKHWSMALAALLMATAVAWSRLALGLHFPSDVLAGAVVGVACAWVSGHFLTRMRLDRASIRAAL